MEPDWNILGPGCLKFFGRMTASATHELNNTMGIINESAGLLEDLGMMAKDGVRPNMDQWMEISNRITAQVQRTYGIIKNLNAFAHGTDHSTALVNPFELLTLVVKLSLRSLAEKNVIAQVAEADNCFEIHTNPFLLLTLMGDCLIYAADHADGKILIRMEQEGNGLQVTFSGVVDEKSVAAPGFPEPELLNALDAEIELRRDQNSLILSMGGAGSAGKHSG